MIFVAGLVTGAASVLLSLLLRVALIRRRECLDYDRRMQLKHDSDREALDGALLVSVLRHSRKENDNGTW